MVVLDPAWPPRSVGKVLETDRLPNALTKILVICFRKVCEDGVGLINGEAVRSDPSLLTGTSCVGSGSSPRPGAALPPGVLLGRNGASDLRRQ